MCCRWFATVTMLARRLELALARLCECESHFSTISRDRPLTRADRGARPSISPAAPDSHGSRMSECGKLKSGLTPIMCSSPTSLNASACDSSVNTDIDSTVRRFIAVGISTNERLLRRRLRSVALHARRSAPEATAKGGANAEPDETSHACRVSDPRPTPNPPRGVGREDSHPHPGPPQPR